MVTVTSRSNLKHNASRKLYCFVVFVLHCTAHTERSTIAFLRHSSILTSPCLRIEDWWRGGSQLALDRGDLRRPVMSPVSDVTVAVTGDGPGPRSDADPCNPLLILDTGSILTVNTLNYTFCITLFSGNFN